MGLSISQIQKIKDGEIAPKNIEAMSIVKIAAANTAVTFLEDYNQFDTLNDQGETINGYASNYVSKFRGVCRRVIATEGNIFKQIRDVCAVIVGKESTIEDIEVADDARWEVYIQAMMVRVFEKIALIERQEKEEYHSFTPVIENPEETTEQ